MSTPTATLLILLSGLLLSACDFSDAARKRVLDSVQASLSKGDVAVQRVAAEMPTLAGALRAGQTEEEVVKIVGKPSGRMTSGKRTVLTYCGETLIFENGRLRPTDPNFSAKVQANKIAASRRAELEKQQALLTASESRRRLAAAPKQVPAAAPVQTQAAAPAPNKPSHQYVDLLTPGCISVVDFYADWCGPCRQLAPILAEIERKNSDAVFNKINIQDWGSEVVSKYHITAVPTVMVFYANGNMVGQPTSAPNQIVDNITRARQGR